MFIDCFTFFNELELLEIRLNYLSPIIDIFLICEATVTHSGLPKPLYYDENKHLFKEFKSKIAHVVVNNMPSVINNNRWALENYQRNAILSGLETLELEKDDYLLIGDVDEIPNLDLIHLKQYGTYDQKCYMYYLNVLSDEHWNGTVGLEYGRLTNHFGSPQKVRDQRNHLEPIRDGGWHFGWLGNYDRVIAKIKAFAHTEVDVPQYTDHLKESIDSLSALWAPGTGPMEIVKIEDISIDYIRDNKEQFKELIYGNI